MTSIDLQNKILNTKNNILNKDTLWVYQQNNFDVFLDNVVIKIIKIIKFILSSKITINIKKKFLKIINNLIDKISSDKSFPLNKKNLIIKKFKTRSQNWYSI